MTDFSERHETWYRLRGWLLVPLLIVMALCRWHEFENDLLVWPVGLAVFAAGVGLRVWSQVHLHYRLDVSKKLTTTGPFTYVRNPVYIANTLILAGLAVLCGLAWLAPVVLAWCAVVYHYVVRYEENHLEQKYGEPYVRYRARVPRWLPRSSPLEQRVDGDFGDYVLPSLRAELYNIGLLCLPIAREVFEHV